MPKIKVAAWSELKDREPAYALAANVDLVVIRYGEEVSVLYGRCLHRGALLSDGSIEGENLICGVHGWDYRCDSGISEYNNAESLQKFTAWMDREGDAVFVDEEEIRAWEQEHPQPYQRGEYQGLYADIHGASEEPFNKHIQQLAQYGLTKVGRHGAPGGSHDDSQVLHICCGWIRAGLQALQAQPVGQRGPG